MKRAKCIARGCNNRSDEGLFIGDMCAPCYHALQSGQGGQGESILFTWPKHIGDLEAALDWALKALSESPALTDDEIVHAPPELLSLIEASTRRILTANDGGGVK